MLWEVFFVCPAEPQALRAHLSLPHFLAEVLEGFLEEVLVLSLFPQNFTCLM